MTQTIEQRLEIYNSVETSLREFFDELNFCQEECLPRRYAYIDLNFSNPRNVGCCDMQHYLIPIGRSFFKNKKEQKNLLSRFQELQKENTLENLLRKEDELFRCNYHTDQGCTIQEYKSPICISFACGKFQDYLRANFNVLYNSGSIFFNLRDVLAGKVTKENADSFITKVNFATTRIKDSKTNPKRRYELIYLAY